ncbi:type-X family DNA polymerase [Patescibacteria group bacterium]|nr:type-X family DNA polymerase [Patescibacteria group bacterium]MBU1123451.1 type-X family DNA polymerase [Patescibacteria group bacterium]MBU1910782.1 type-X family DNA polymerase [Patescibacteria group bacterium]
MENNKAIAGLLRQIAALLQEQEVAFKPAAYRRAAQVIEDLPQDVSTYGDKKNLKKLPGIGEAIAGKIIEYLETGKMTALENLRVSQGGIPAELMDIEGLGPKRVRQVQEAFGVKSVADLVKACEDGKLRTLPRFSELMEKKVLENAKRVKERVKRFDRNEIKDDVEKLLNKIKGLKGVDKCEVAGSYRREKETVGDIDILVVTTSPKEVSDSVASLKDVRNVVAHGDKKLSFDLNMGLRVDVRFVKADQWGSALLYFTGSKEHNIAMRKVAMSNGWKLNEYGLFQGDAVLVSKTEDAIYKKLGLEFREPRERTGRL